MNAFLGLFALSLLGAEGPRDRAAPDISYEVRVVKVQGLDWRREFFSQLQPVTTQSGASVWTTSDETADNLAAKDPAALRAPKITAGSHNPAHISNRANRRVASGVTRMADGPYDHATKVAYSPNYEEIREGFALTLSGRKIDQGVLAFVVLDETRVAAVHHLDLSETLAAAGCCAKEGECEVKGKAGEGNEVQAKGVIACEEACAKGKIASRIEIPEVVHHAVAGEWLIPNMGALVVSLGVQTVDDGSGRAVPAERLMLIEATPLPDAAVRQASLSGHAWTQVPNPEAVPKPPAAIEGNGLPTPDATAKPNPMPMPAVPSRSLPQPLAADGTPLQLPPLPEDQAPPSSLPNSSEPCASPQAKDRKPSPAPEAATVDPASRKASFLFDGSPLNPAPAGAPRPFVLRFPVTAGNVTLDIEVRASSPFPGAAKVRPATPAPAVD